MNGVAGATPLLIQFPPIRRVRQSLLLMVANPLRIRTKIEITIRSTRIFRPDLCGLSIVCSWYYMKMIDIICRCFILYVGTAEWRRNRAVEEGHQTDTYACKKQHRKETIIWGESATVRKRYHRVVEGSSTGTGGTVGRVLRQPGTNCNGSIESTVVSAVL
jgi:hypothetical protein